MFGGSTLTATDVAVAAGLVDIGNRDLLNMLSMELVSAAKDKIMCMVQEAIESIKDYEDDVPVILVGGGSVLIDQLSGACSLVRPVHYDVANAVGAALSQVSGESADFLEDLTGTTEEEAVDRASEWANEMAIKAGAQPDSIMVISILTYIIYMYISDTDV